MLRPPFLAAPRTAAASTSAWAEPRALGLPGLPRGAPRLGRCRHGGLRGPGAAAPVAEPAGGRQVSQEGGSGPPARDEGERPPRRAARGARVGPGLALPRPPPPPGSARAAPPHGLGGRGGRWSWRGERGEARAPPVQRVRGAGPGALEDGACRLPLPTGPRHQVACHGFQLETRGWRVRLGGDLHASGGCAGGGPAGWCGAALEAHSRSPGSTAVGERPLAGGSGGGRHRTAGPQLCCPRAGRLAVPVGGELGFSSTFVAM